MPLPRVPPPPGPPPALPVRYEVGAMLGQGGMGRVYRARDRVLGIDVAVKVIRPDLATDPRVRERLAVEVQLAARLPHPHLVPLHDLGTMSDGTPFFAMALAEEGSLGSLRGGWPVLAGRMREVLAALGALHARGVLHRDLKPENVLLHAGRAWVSDLGLAEVADSLARRSSDVSGTPEYMSPEQRSGRTREFGPWTDLYAVGRMLERMSVGMIVPSGLDDLLTWLLHPEPYARYERAADVLHALDRLGLPEVVRDRMSPEHGSSAPTLYPSQLFGDATPATGLRALATPSRSELPTLLDRPSAHAPEATPPRAGAAPRLRPPAMPVAPSPEPGRGTHARASLALLALREVPLVAREGARAELWAHARAVVADGAPRVVIVVGEAGAGRTRLVNSVGYALEEGGWMDVVRLAYRVPPTPDDGSGGLARRLLRPGGESPDSLEERLVRQLSADFGPDASAWAARMRRWCGLLYRDETPVDRASGLALLWERLFRRGWRGGTCLVLDDAHFAEGAEGLGIARSLLDQAQAGERVPVLVLATVRSDALATSPALARQVEGLVEDGAVRLDLPRLDRAGTAALLDELLTLTPDLAELVSARCEGNPLLARLLLSGWADEGLLVDGGDLAHGLPPGLDVATALPDTSSRFFERRVATLVASSADPHHTREALHALALAEEALPVEVFELLAGTAAATLERSGVFRRDGATYVWDHGMLQEAVRREAWSRRDRAALHRRVADAWADWGRVTGANTDDEVGQHLVEAGEPGAALRLLLPACARAEDSGRMAALLRLATAAQRAADRLGPSALVAAREARYRRARALTVRGELDAAEKLLGEADALAAGPAPLGTLPNDLLPADLARDAAPTDEDRGPKVEAYAAWVRGHLERLRARLDVAALAFSSARERWMALGDQDRAAHATLQLAGCRRHVHAFDDAEALYRDAEATWRALHNRRGEAYALRERAVLASWRGDVDRADHLLAECRLLFRAAGEAVGEGVAMMRQSQRALAVGRPELAEELLREAMHLFVANGALLEVQNCRNDLAEVARQRGNLAAARAGYRAAVRWSEERGWREFVAIGRVNLALVALTAGDPLEALVEAERMVDALALSRNHWLRPFAEAIRAAAHSALGQHAEAALRLRRARKRGLGAQADRDLAWVLDQLAGSARAGGAAELAAEAAELADRVRPGRKVEGG